VSSDHPLFTSWLDLEGEKCMFNEYQLENWEQDHLWACYWYLEMLLDKTPHHEEGHRRSVEPSFKAPNPVPQSAKKASNASNGGGRKSKDKMSRERQHLVPRSTISLPMHRNPQKGPNFMMIK
jgi:hypothetical protein